MKRGEALVLHFLVPTQAVEGGLWACAKKWCEENGNFACGCPECLERLDLTLVWIPEDVPDVNRISRAVKPCPIATALLAKENICKGYLEWLDR